MACIKWLLQQPFKAPTNYVIFSLLFVISDLFIILNSIAVFVTLLNLYYNMISFRSFARFWQVLGESNNLPSLAKTRKKQQLQPDFGACGMSKKRFLCSYYIPVSVIAAFSGEATSDIFTSCIFLDIPLSILTFDFVGDRKGKTNLAVFSKLRSSPCFFRLFSVSVPLIGAVELLITKGVPMKKWITIILEQLPVQDVLNIFLGILTIYVKSTKNKLDDRAVEIIKIIIFHAFESD